MKQHIPRLPVTSCQVVHDVRMPDTLCNLVCVPRIPFERDNLAQITHHPQMPLFVFVTVRHDDLRAGLAELGDRVSAQESSTSENRRDVARDC